MTEHPSAETRVAKHPAAFINVIAEDGTKQEAVRWLQKTWDELVDARAEIERLQADAPIKQSKCLRCGAGPEWQT